MDKQNEKTEVSSTFEQELSVKEFIDRIDRYLDGESQDAPEIIWFDNKSYDHLKFARTPDYLGFAETLSMNQHITMDSFVGSRMGTHLVRDKVDSSFTLMTPEQIFHYDEGILREKILILRCMSSDTGQNAVNLGKLIKESLGINVIIFMPYFQKEKITASFNGYAEFRLKDK